MENQKETALAHLRNALNDANAQFRVGQWECIEQLLKNRRLLVVQRTGWGKSYVYFIATKMLRNNGRGVTLLISPLLSLMRNQIYVANKLGLRTMSIDSTNKDNWEEVETLLLSNQVDLLLVSPERLANENFMNYVYSKLDIGCFVVDEAHCISDWGHDFRRDYKRIKRLIQNLPSNIPVLATTATANKRVTADVAEQLGNIIIQRGSLIRSSLRLQTTKMDSPIDRFAWLAEQLPKLKGSGIIYVLTKQDAESLAGWLQNNGIVAYPYHSESQNRVRLESQLLNNEIKALVATVALGMGFDKPDLGFVIHYQRPASVVHYYQQVGRAGRDLNEAFGVLLAGEEDDEISDYFMKSAFPSERFVNQVLELLENSVDGLSIYDIQKSLNIKHKEVDQVIDFLASESPSPIFKVKSKWLRTASAYKFDQSSIDDIIAIRKHEQSEMKRYLESETCLMRFLANALDDDVEEDCGICSVCMSKPVLQVGVKTETQIRATNFLRGNFQIINPRKNWPTGYQFRDTEWSGRIKDELVAEEGRSLALWGDPGWGKLIRDGKYKLNHFSDELVNAVCEMVVKWNPNPKPEWITCVPSLKHPTLVRDFSIRLSERLNVDFVDCFSKVRQNSAQKEMNNSYQQVRNIEGAFEITADVRSTPLFLIDDMVDSKWTMTYLAALLRERGSGAVFPLALALNSKD